MLKGNVSKSKKEEKKMTGVLKELLVLLEERLVEHDENRKEVQNKLLEACSKIREDADSLEERISKEISEDFNAKEERILGLIEKLNEGGGDMNVFVKKAKKFCQKSGSTEFNIMTPELVLLIHMGSRSPRLRLKRSSVLTAPSLS